jgi:penicillin-binding protein 1A
MKRTKKTVNHKKRIINGIVISFLLVCLLTVILGFNAITTNISDYKYEPKGKTMIYSSDNVLIAEIFDENRTYVEIDQVPQDLINAVVAVEDRNFYNHYGISIKGIGRAIVNNIVSKNAYSEGGITITQQVVKRLFLSDKKSYIRKLNEAILAVKMEKAFTKDEILEIYLNQMYLGAGTYGVEEASRKYFGKDVKDLNIAQCTLIAGLFQAPSAYCPFDNYDEAIKRQHEVIDAMVDTGYITKEKAEEIKNMPIKLSSSSRGFRVLHGKYRSFCRLCNRRILQSYNTGISKKYAMDYESAKLLAQKHLTYDGVTIKTTLNYKAQKDAVASINAVLKSYGLTQKATALR